MTAMMAAMSRGGGERPRTRPSSQALEFWDLMRSAPQQVSLPVEQRRAAGEHAEDGTQDPVGVRRQDWPAHHGLTMHPEGGQVDARVLYLFGGGYVLGSPQSRAKTAGHLAIAARADVYVPDYRLAPEHPYPAALDDVLTAWDEMAHESVPCFVAGDSAGGGLALALCLAIAARGTRTPDGVVAFSPWADLTCSGSSFADHAERDIECTRESLTEMAEWYAPGLDHRDPLLSPVFGDPGQLPPVIVFVGSEEVLLDDATRVVRAVGGVGGDASLVIAAGMQHVYPIWSGVFPEAQEAIDSAGSWIRARSTSAD